MILVKLSLFFKKEGDLWPLHHMMHTSCSLSSNAQNEIVVAFVVCCYLLI